MLFGDWRDTRAALEKAFEKIGEKPTETGYPKRDWDLVSEAIGAYREAQAYTCIECKSTVAYGTEIRCLDCKATLCEVCAPRHFWPNGRPKS
jgi:hypothetical protein